MGLCTGCRLSWMTPSYIFFLSDCYDLRLLSLVSLSLSCSGAPVETYFVSTGKHIITSQKVMNMAPTCPWAFVMIWLVKPAMLDMALVMMGVEVRELRNWGWAPKDAALIWAKKKNHVCEQQRKLNHMTRVTNHRLYSYNGRIDGESCSLQSSYGYIGLRDGSGGWRRLGRRHLSGSNLSRGHLHGLRGHLLHGSLHWLYGRCLRLEHRRGVCVQLGLDRV